MRLQCKLYQEGGRLSLIRGRGIGTCCELGDHLYGPRLTHVVGVRCKRYNRPSCAPHLASDNFADVSLTFHKKPHKLSAIGIQILRDAHSQRYPKTGR
eukprot:1793671-Rhodomonas_salina.1